MHIRERLDDFIVEKSEIVGEERSKSLYTLRACYEGVLCEGYFSPKKETRKIEPLKPYFRYKVEAILFYYNLYLFAG